MATLELLSQIARTVREMPTMAKLFNWNEIAKLPLPDSFIIEHADYLNWDVLAKYQTLSVDLAEQFDDTLKKRMHILVLNSELHTDVFRKYAQFMDWETAQKHQRFTPDLLEHFMGSMDLLIVLQHQKIPENLLEIMLQPTIDRANWKQLRRYLDLVFTYQAVSNVFLNKFLLLENSLYKILSPVEGVAMPNIPQIILVDLPLVIKHQKLDEEFLTAFCIPHVKARDEICRSQKLSLTFINEHFDVLDVSKLLKYQRLDEPTLMRCCERSIFRQKTKPRVDKILSSIKFLNAIHLNNESMQVNNADESSDDEQPSEPSQAQPSEFSQEQPSEFSQAQPSEFSQAQPSEPQQDEQPIEVDETPGDVDRRFNYALLLLEKQDYSLELARQIIDSMPTTNRRKVLWNTVFLRTLAPIGNDAYLGFSLETVAEQIVPNVDWVAMADIELSQSQLEYVINLAADRMPWYLYIKRNELSESQIISLQNAGKIDAITWWRILTVSRKTPLSHSFIATYGDRKKWWNYVNGVTFYTTCLQALDNVDTIEVEGTNLEPIASKADIRAFLQDFARATKWHAFLQEELLPEWFLQIFGSAQLVKHIPKYWWYVARWQVLPQKFIERNASHLDLQMLLTYQTVTEEFIRDKVPFFTPENWKSINTRQTVSDAFREEFATQLAV